MALFASVAIVLHIAERRTALKPDDAEGRTREIGWLFAAKDPIEPPIVERSMAVMSEATALGTRNACRCSTSGCRCASPTSAVRSLTSAG